MRVNPFHSKLPGIEVYHTYSECTVGNNIESRNKVKGTGGKRQCSFCENLHSDAIARAIVKQRKPRRR